MDEVRRRADHLPGKRAFTGFYPGKTAALATFSPSLSLAGDQRLIRTTPIQSMALGY